MAVNPQVAAARAAKLKARILHAQAIAQAAGHRAAAAQARAEVARKSSQAAQARAKQFDPAKAARAQSRRRVFQALGHVPGLFGSGLKPVHSVLGIAKAFSAQPPGGPGGAGGGGQGGGGQAGWAQLKASVDAIHALLRAKSPGATPQTPRPTGFRPTYGPHPPVQPAPLYGPHPAPNPARLARKVFGRPKPPAQPRPAGTPKFGPFPQALPTSQYGPYPAPTPAAQAKSVFGPSPQTQPASSPQTQPSGQAGGTAQTGRLVEALEELTEILKELVRSQGGAQAGPAGNLGTPKPPERTGKAIDWDRWLKGRGASRVGQNPDPTARQARADTMRDQT